MPKLQRSMKFLFCLLLVTAFLGCIFPPTYQISVQYADTPYQKNYDQYGYDSVLPPPIEFQSSPDVVVLPDTNYVYVVPGISIDLFFWDGWWWRPWEGRWYRSQNYNNGWSYYKNVPSFYYDVDPGWRGYYRDRNWYGHRWDYERIPNQRLKQNWKNWNNNRYWENQRTWGVQDYQPRPQRQRQELREQREQQYQQRLESQRNQQRIQQDQDRKQDQQGQKKQKEDKQKKYQEDQDRRDSERSR